MGTRSFLAFYAIGAAGIKQIIKNWPVREQLKVGDKNVIHDQLVPCEKIIFPPLHIKLGLMKQFVKTFDKTGQCFQYISSAFPGLSNEKLKAGIFDIHQIRKRPTFNERNRIG